MARLRYGKSKIFGYGYLEDSHHKWLKENIPIVFDRYMRLYMRYMPEFDCSVEQKDDFLRRWTEFQLCNNLIYLRNRYGQPTTLKPFLWKYRYHGSGEVDEIPPWRNQDHSFTCYIEITKIEEERSHGLLAEGMITIFDETGSKSTLFQLQFQNKKLIKAASILGTPMMNMDHQNREKNHIRSLGTMGSLSENVQMSLQWGLTMIRKGSLDKFQEDTVSIHHEPYELVCFQRAIRISEFSNFTASNIVAFVYQDYYIDGETHIQTFDLPLFASDWFGQFPLVDLTEKEMNQINRHLHSLNISTAHGDPYDITEYLTEPEYGKVLRLPIPSVELVFDYIMKEEIDFIRFVMGYRDGDMIPFVTVDCCNLHHFNIRDSLMSIRANVSFLNNHDLYSDYQELHELLLNELKSAETVVTILANALDIYVIGKHRPHRMRITKISEPKHHLLPLYDAAHQPPEEKEYVITRIMRTIRRTNDLCEELNHQHRDRPAQYVVESWKRCGHWRTTPNGSKVWIEPTICHRHQPLTEKEVHIML